MAPLGDSPFAALTVVVAPAILTNATSVLCLGTGNRIARVVDRTRIVARDLAGLEVGSQARDVSIRQLVRLQERAQILFRALRLFYTALGSFAATVLISIAGAAFAGVDRPSVFGVLAAIAFAAGTIGVSGLAVGCGLMVRETRLAVRNLSEEATFARSQYETYAPM
jgi:hypothetical protein